MLCAHTVRRLKPGRYDDFKAAFTPKEGEFPSGWVRFHALRSLADENEVITFGLFDGTFEELERSQAEGDYEERRASIDQYVDEVVLNGVYEVAGAGTCRPRAPDGGEPLMRWFRRRRRDPLVCREFVELVTDYLEGTLPAEARARFDAHLSECDGCSGSRTCAGWCAR